MISIDSPQELLNKQKPKLNHDILREVFYRIFKGDRWWHDDIEKFMMCGRESFQLVLDIFERATNPVFFGDRVNAQLPHVEYNPPTIDSDMDSDDDDGDCVGSKIFTRFLMKPISLALAATITSLDLRSFNPALIPMLKSLDREMTEVKIFDSDKQLKLILEACVNIPNVRNEVIIRLCAYFDFASGMKTFAIPCRKLTIKRAYFSTMYQGMNLNNPFLRNIRDLKIQGKFRKTCTIHKELNEFAAFLSVNFPNLETLNINFLLKGYKNYYWNWNDSKMASFFRTLRYGIKGSICFKIVNEDLEEINRAKFPDVQESNEEYYKIFPVTPDLSFKLAYWYDVEVPQVQYYDSDGYSS